MTRRSATIPPSTADAAVAVLVGGTSSERAVSLDSGAAVLDALADTADGRGPRALRRVEIEADGRWNDGGGPRPVAEALARLDVDAVFLALHGGDGEDGHVQGLLSMTGVAFTGSGVAGSALALDKWNARIVAAHAGLEVARAELFGRASWEAGGAARLAALLDAAPDGVCVKPRRGGSSVLAEHARDGASAEAAVVQVLEDGDDALVELWIGGVETACGVLGHAGALRALAPVEIRPHEGRFFDYEEKYSDAGALELCPPEAIAPATCTTLREHALEAHVALGCRGYSRSDFVVRSADQVPVFLEANTLPGLTRRSLLPLAAAEVGMSFRDLCLAILDLAAEAD